MEMEPMTAKEFAKAITGKLPKPEGTFSRMERRQNTNIKGKYEIAKAESFSRSSAVQGVKMLVAA